MEAEEAFPDTARSVKNFEFHATPGTEQCLAPGEVLTSDLAMETDGHVDADVDTVEVDGGSECEVSLSVSAPSDVSRSNFQADISSDPATFAGLKNYSDEMIKLILKLGPSQPVAADLPGKEFPKKGKDNRHFHETWYWRKLADNKTVKRDWLSYSPSTDKMYCIHCMLFSTGTCNKAWTKDGVQRWHEGLTSIIVHETSDTHVAASLKFKLREVSLPLNASAEEKRKFNVARNREIVRELIDVTLYLARHNLAFRGHREQWTESIRGNFRDLVVLLAKYSPAMAAYLDSVQSSNNKKKRSFFTWSNQNRLINAIATFIRKEITKELKSAGFFSVSMDSTFDLAKHEQLAFIVRYVGDTSEVNERLLAMKRTNSTKSTPLFELFKETCAANGLDWREFLVGQSYDGALNMRGDISGLKTKILEENNAAIFIWCFAHRLNLVVKDAVDCNLNSMDLFANLEGLYTFISSSKCRIAILEQNQEKHYKGQRRKFKRLKRVKSTRWGSYKQALSTVLDNYDAVIDTLEFMRQTPERRLMPGEKVTDDEKKAAVEAGGYLRYFSSERFLLTALSYNRIFKIVDPVSKILQAPDLDLLAAATCIEDAKRELRVLRDDKVFADILEEKENFIRTCKTDVEWQNLPVPRKRRVPTHYGELARDTPIDDPLDKFRVETYFVAVDHAISEISSRFGDLTVGIFKDLALLSRRRLMEVNGEPDKLPSDAFDTFCGTYPQFVDKMKLRHQYLQFSKVFQSFEKANKLPQQLHPQSENGVFDELGEDIFELFDDDSSDEDEPKSTSKSAATNADSISSVFKVMFPFAHLSFYLIWYSVFTVNITFLFT